MFRLPDLHRNKRSLTLDLKKPEGHATFMKLVEKADVIIENMRSEVKHRLKVSYDDVKKVNPRIVYGSISGFGQSGPYGKRAGVDQIVQGMGGLMSITGLPGQGPVRVGVAIADLTAGNPLALSIMMALFDRTRTGVGKWVHTSLLESIIFMLDFQASRWLMDKEVAPQAGNDHPTGTPTGVFPASDGFFNIARRPSACGRMCDALGRRDGRPNRLGDAAERTTPPGSERAIGGSRSTGLRRTGGAFGRRVPCGPHHDRQCSPIAVSIWYGRAGPGRMGVQAVSSPINRKGSGRNPQADAESRRHTERSAQHRHRRADERDAAQESSRRPVLRSETMYHRHRHRAPTLKHPFEKRLRRHLVFTSEKHKHSRGDALAAADVMRTVARRRDPRNVSRAQGTKLSSGGPLEGREARATKASRTTREGDRFRQPPQGSASRRSR